MRHEIIGGEIGDEDALHHGMPIPVVARPGVVDGPVGEKGLVEIFVSGFARFDEAVVFAGMADAD